MGGQHALSVSGQSYISPCQALKKRAHDPRRNKPNSQSKGSINLKHNYFEFVYTERSDFCSRKDWEVFPLINSYTFLSSTSASDAPLIRLYKLPSTSGHWIRWQPCTGGVKDSFGTGSCLITPKYIASICSLDCIG